MDNNELTGKIIGAAKELGPGLLESAYQACLEFELRSMGLNVRGQVDVPVNYKGIVIPVGYRLDILVEDIVIIELKTVENIQPLRKAQLLTYLKLMHLRYGLLLNFRVEKLQRGICRIVNG
jgi:GxxExxY protein